MKEANYTRFRQILSDASLYGDEILALFKSQNKALGLSKKAYDLVYEGFWDLYCKKPAVSADIPMKKLDGFIQRVKLITPPNPEGGDEEGTVSARNAAQLPLKALVRVRIPLNRPPPEKVDLDNVDDGNGAESEPNSSRIDTNRSGMHTAREREHQQLSTHPDEDQTGFTEQPIEDRVLQITTIAEGTRIWLMH